MSEPKVVATIPAGEWGRLVERAMSAEAAIARVEALADAWDERKRPGMVGVATAIRAALRGEDA